MLIVPSVSRSLQHLKPTPAAPATTEKTVEGHSKSNGNGAAISNGKAIKVYSSEPTLITTGLHETSAVKSPLTVPENNGLSKKPSVPVNNTVPSPPRNDSESENEESQNNLNEEIWKNLVISSSANLSPLTTTSAKLKTG